VASGCHAALLNQSRRHVAWTARQIQYGPLAGGVVSTAIGRGVPT